ncbi:monofunctional biosynthetic peptidoglycan transglycosylase [Alkanindiges illinoisensis]|uniref:Biosynthetic peptidoglycan transglycosylase n=1 Tax=Alkanindiges illinoisensis TaxID=197183 RepID=A0A4Y7XD67_9GAMM|nr:monofunctional biosynthetic peptidoglycan transglycosylase [Alkanindiges illinoisensis]TEU28583.1 monofunctional biosynthetic peptidoglycan transglycosylase [Alkanindiges illinoisensis]
MKAFIARAVLIGISVFLLVQLWIFSSLVWWKYQPVERSMFMRIYEWNYKQPAIRHEWKDSDRISNNLKRALIAGEDAKFIDHSGFDWTGIQLALTKNEKKGEVVAGGSTISQQLAKNLFLFNQRSYIRKGQEAIATWMMERLWSKQRILEVYVNSVEFGKGIYGAEAAAQYYFGKSAANLSKSEAAQLAAYLPNPKYYQDHPADRKVRTRKARIQRYMGYVRLPKDE